MNSKITFPSWKFTELKLIIILVRGLVSETYNGELESWNNDDLSLIFTRKNRPYALIKESVVET